MIIILLLVMILTMSTGVYVYDSAVESVNTEKLETIENAIYNDSISQYEVDLEYDDETELVNEVIINY